MTTHPCRCCGRDSSPLRWACPACVAVTRQRLRELDDHAVVIEASLIPGRGWPDGLPRARGYESTPPTNLDLLTALDYRSHLDGTGPDDDPNEGTLSLLGSLQQLVRYVRAQRQDVGLFESLPSTTITGLSLYLSLHTEWCAHQLWGDQFVNTIAHLHGQARRQAHDAPPVPLGRCIEEGCDGVVWRDQGDTDRGRCSLVRTHAYTGLHLARLAQRQAS